MRIEPVTPALAPGAGVRPGIQPQVVLGAVSNPYTGDKAAIMAGRQLFTGMNCAGCHSGYAGGGMGPSLRDSLWIYGNGDAQIFSSIAEGAALRHAGLGRPAAGRSDLAPGGLHPHPRHRERAGEAAHALA